MPSDSTILEIQEFNADIIVIGGGLSGLAAALTAAENGLKVIVLEKMNFIGGAGLFPEGSLGIGTRYQKENCVETTVDKVFIKAMEFHHWRCNASVVRTLLEESGKTIDWLEGHGVEIEGIRTMFPPEISLQVWHIFKGSGTRVVKKMSEGIRKRGGMIITKTPVKHLIKDDRGVVSGVEAENSEGKAFLVMARAFIIATGGFPSNSEMLKKYVPDVSTPGMAKLMYRGPVIDGRTGDGINLALEANASLIGMQTIAGNSSFRGTALPPRTP